MKKIKLLLLTGCISLFMYSCTTTEIPITQDPTNIITYNKDVRTIINNSCATSACHDNTAPAAGLQLTNYTLVKNAAQNGNFHVRIDAGTMPPSAPLSNATKAIINKWRADGYLEN